MEVLGALAALFTSTLISYLGCQRSQDSPPPLAIVRKFKTKRPTVTFSRGSVQPGPEAAAAVLARPHSAAWFVFLQLHKTSSWHLKQLLFPPITL